MGKPNNQFFKAAVKSMGLNIQECAMIGDDLDSDVIGMNNAGGMGIQVRTGKFRDSIRSIEKPHLIIDSIHSIIGIINS
jgi:ribonucleotide monophosphatase NagD (HAD superfamily)